MLKQSFFALAVAQLFFCCSPSAQNNTTSNTTTTTTSDGTLPPVETKSPNTNYKPAFAGQTRVAGVKTTTPYDAVVLSSALKRPWGIVQMPDGRFLVNEKDGNMRIVSATGTPGEPITGIPAVNAAGQGGLLGLTLDPDFALTGWYIGYFLKKPQVAT
jgi:glucose/arabinose dehydrogenase